PLQDRTFDDFGELIRVDWAATSAGPPFSSIVHQYDALGRLVHSEEQNNSVADAATLKDYAYDTGVVTPQVTPTNVLGRLARASAPTGDVVFSYDAFGNANAKNFRDSGGTAYVEKHTFHGDGSPVSLELDLPDTGYTAERVNYAFDSAGRLRSMVYSS